LQTVLYVDSEIDVWNTKADGAARRAILSNCHNLDCV